MSNRGRKLLSFGIAFISGNVGFVLAATFVPLIFPLSLTGATLGTDFALLSLPVFFLIFGTTGFVICWKFTKRFSEPEKGAGRTFTD
jgi:hypothetical protein